MIPVVGLLAGAAGWLFDKLAEPALRGAAGAAYEAVTGEALPADAPVKDVVEKVQALPAEQQAVVVQAILDQEVELARIDGRNQEALTKGSAEWVRATARPEIALRAMKSIQYVVYGFAALVATTVLQWLIETLSVLLDGRPVDVPSVWALLAQVRDSWELVAISFGSGFLACVRVVERYMACRERDKAQQFEMEAGRPLKASDAVETAAGGVVASVIRAVRGK